MPDIIDSIIAEARSKEEKPFGLTYDEGLAMLGLIQCAAAILSSKEFGLILMINPGLIPSVNMLQLTDPNADIAESMSDRLMKFCEEHKPS